MNLPDDILALIAEQEYRLNGESLIVKYLKWNPYEHITYFEVHGDNIYDDDLLKFKCLSTVILRENTKLTDEGLKNLHGIFRLNLKINPNINDIKLLQGIKHLKLFCIRDGDLQYLKDIKSLSCNFIMYNSDNLLYLQGIEELTLKICEVENNTEIYNYHIKCFRGIKKLVLIPQYSDCLNINDEALSYLSGIEKLYLHNLSIHNSYERSISDMGLIYLSGIKYLKITGQGNNHITDLGLSYLSGIETLQINNSYDKNITNEGLSHIRGIKELIIHGKCDITTTEGLENIEKLSLYSPRLYGGFHIFANIIELDLVCGPIYDCDLKWMPKLKTLRLYGIDLITDDGLVYITSIVHLTLDNNTTITDNGLKYLTNLISLSLSHNLIITDEGLSYLPNLELLHLDNNTLITDKGLSYLPKLTSIALQASTNIKKKYNFNFSRLYIKPDRKCILL